LKFFLIPTADNLDPDEEDNGSEPKNEEEDKTVVKKPLDKLEKPKPKKEFTPHITVTILDIEEKADKNKNKYLLLETDNLPNNVFV
jgi:hypothetical protein